MVKKSEEKKLIKGLKNENEILRNKLLFMETVNPLSLENLKCNFNCLMRKGDLHLIVQSY